MDKIIYNDSITECEHMELILQMLIDNLPYANKHFVDTGALMKNTGYFGVEKRTYSIEGMRATNNYAALYAFLYNELAEKDYPNAGQFKRNLKEKAIKSIRYGIFTHNSVKKMRCTAPTHNMDYWGPPDWQSSFYSHKLLFAAHLMWEYLDDEIRHDVKTVAESEGDRGVRTPPKQYRPGDTGSEENAWDTNGPSIAYNMFPNHPRAGAWRDAAIKFAMNSLPRKADMGDSALVDGKPASEWITTWNLFDDYSLENHAILHPLYQASANMSFADSVVYYKYFGHSVPEAFRYNVEKNFNHVLKKLIYPGGEWIYANNCDWDLMLPGVVEQIAYMATLFQDPEAKLLEKRSLQFSRKRQLAGGDRRIMPSSPFGIGREAVEIKRIMYVYLLHKYVSPWSAKDVSWENFIANNSSTATFLENTVITNHNINRFASFSWKNRFMGLITPSNNEYLNKGYITHPNLPNLVGNINIIESPPNRAYGAHINCINKDSFSTIGYFNENGGLLKRYISVTALPGNAVVVMELIQAQKNVTVTENNITPLSFMTDAIAGGKDKTITTSAGADSFEAGSGAEKISWRSYSGDWVDIDGHTSVILDRERMILFGGMTISSAAEGCTLKFAADTGSFAAGEVVSRTTNVVLSNIGGINNLKKLKEKIQYLDMPDGWQGILLEDTDGKSYFVISNFYGKESVCISVPGKTDELRLESVGMESRYGLI